MEIHFFDSPIDLNECDMSNTVYIQKTVETRQPLTEDEFEYLKEFLNVKLLESNDEISFRFLGFGSSRGLIW